MKEAISYCPSCKKENPWNALKCQHCGEDFTPKEEQEKTIVREGLAYGSLSSVALVVGQASAILGAILFLFIFVYSIIQLNFVDAFINGLLMFFVMIALYVTFKRVEDL